MAQFEMNLHDYWLIIRRRKVIIVVATLLVALLSFWFTRQRVPVYESTSSVRYEQSTSLTGLLVEVLAVGGGDNVETQGQVIKSYPVMEDVLRRMGRLPERAPGQPLRESRTYLNALDALGARIRTQRVAATSVFEITVSSTTPSEAREIADTVAEAYRDYNRGLRNARITEARKYIEKQLTEAEVKVKRTEEQVWAFREANSIISPGAESSVLLTVFTQLRGTLETVRQQRAELEYVQTRLARLDPASLTDRIYVETSNVPLLRLQETQIGLVMEYNNLALEVTDRHPRLQALLERLREIRLEMRRELGALIALLRSREEILARQTTEVLQKNRDLPAVELGLQRLQRDAKSSEDLLTLLRTRYQEALIKESERVEEVTIVRPATDPVESVASDTFNTVLIGSLLGLMLGLVVAFVQETLDTSIGTIEDVEAYLGVPVLGIIPHIDTRATIQRLIERRPALAEVQAEFLQSHALLITHFDPKSPAAEAYRTLRTNIQFIQMERGGKLLVFTSPTRQEGKSTTIVNCALTMAQNGQRTLLVGANLRRPSIHRFFGIEREPGLSDILVGNVPWRDCVRTVADILMGRFEMEDIIASPGLDNLHIIESGPVPANPSELLSAPTMARFLREVREEYDIVLIDTPPILPVTDAAIAGAQTDGVVLVYRSGVVGRLVLKRAKAHIESARASVWGVVLNDVQSEITGYHQYYARYYGEEPGAAKTAGPLGRLWARLRGRSGEAKTRPWAAEESPSAEGHGGDTDSAWDGQSAGRSRRKYRNILGGLGLVLLLASAIAGVTAWHMGRFNPGDWPLNPRDWPLNPRVWSPNRPMSETPPPQAEGDVRPAPAPSPGAAAPPAQAIAPVTTPSTQAAGPVAAVTTPSTPPVPARSRSAPATRTADVPRETGVKETPVVSPGPRFAVELGPFITGDQAEKTERQLNEGGFQTVRFRQQTGATLYAVLIERLPGQREAQTLVATLREQGFPDAVIVGSGDALSVRVGEPRLLRSAVELGEGLRAKGHLVRVAAQRGEAQTFVIRHGNFASREEAEAKGAELARLGLPNVVVRAK